MQPTGPQIERLQQALLSAYPRLEHVRLMVRIHLDAEIDAVVPLYGQNQTDILFALIDHYAAQPGGLHRLIEAARAGNPGNQLLAAVAAEFLAIPFDPNPVRKQRGEILWVNVPPKPAAPLLGRDDLIADFLARLSAGHSPALSTDGLPGVGKTALGVALAHDERVRQVLPDGVLWGGLGQQPDVVTVQNQWAAALGVELVDEPDVHRRAERLSRVLGDRRVLVVIDDAWTIEAAQALRLSSPHVVHLLTTRDRAIARQFAGAGQQVHVSELAPDPACELLRRLAPEACAADPDAARTLVATVGNLPLAIEVLGGYLANHDLTVFPDLAPEAFDALGDAKQRLALATERLGGQPGRQESMEKAIRLSVEALPAEAATVFWSLGAFAPKPATFDRAAAEAVTQAQSSTLALLVGRNLVEVADGVLAVHQVVHDAMAGAVPKAVVERHRQYYLDLVNEDREDWKHIQIYYEQLRFAWKRLVESGELSPQVFEFVSRLRTYQQRRGIWSDMLTWCERALRYAQAESLVMEQASILVHLGAARDALAEKRLALDCYAEALQLFRQVGDEVGESGTLNNIGRVYASLGDNHQALEYYLESLPLSRKEGDFSGEATTLNNIGTILARLDENNQALRFFGQALLLFEKAENKSGAAMSLNGIGSVYNALGDNRLALHYYSQALSLRRLIGDKAGEVLTLSNIGRVLWQEGRAEETISIQVMCITVAQEIGDIAGESSFRMNLAAVLNSVGRVDEAIRCVETSIALLERHQLPQNSAGETLDHQRSILARLSTTPSVFPQHLNATLDQLCALVVEARRDDEELFAQLHPVLEQAVTENSQDPALRRFFMVLIGILAGNDDPEISELLPEYLEKIRRVLSQLTG